MCSWECVKNICEVGSHTFLLFFRRATGMWPPADMKLAPPRMALVAFGGRLTIEEFRDKNLRTSLTFPKMQAMPCRYRDGVWVLGAVPKMGPRWPARKPASSVQVREDRVLDLSMVPSSSIDQLRLKKAKKDVPQPTSHHDIMQLMKK